MLVTANHTTITTTETRTTRVLDTLETRSTSPAVNNQIDNDE